MNATNATAILNNATTIAVAANDSSYGSLTSSTTIVAQGTLLTFGILIFSLSFIASIFCVILISAMILPLASAKGRAVYSTYNLYLAFLSIPDLAANIFIAYSMFIQTPWVGQQVSDEDSSNTLWFDDSPYDDALYEMCICANLYTNAFLTFEIYKLLKYSSLRKRYYPPTVGKVTKQAMIAFLVGASVFVVDFFLVADHIDNNTMGLSPQMLQTLDWLHFAFTWIVCVVVPISVLVVVTVMIYRQGLIASTESLYEGRLRTLSFFFLRIVFIEIMVWIPSAVAFSIYWITEDNNRTKVVAYNISIVFSGIQVIVNFVCALTKPDTKKLIVDLPQRLCCDCWQLCGPESNSDIHDEHNNNHKHGAPRRLFRDPFLRMRRSSLSSSFHRFGKRSRSINSNTMRDEEHGGVDESTRREVDNNTGSIVKFPTSSSNQPEIDTTDETCNDAC